MYEETIYEGFTGENATETQGVISVEVIEAVKTDIVHADLFGSFLVCGTLVGLALLRGFRNA